MRVKFDRKFRSNLKVGVSFEWQRNLTILTARRLHKTRLDKFKI